MIGMSSKGDKSVKPKGGGRNDKPQSRGSSADTKAHWLFLGEQVEKLVDQGDKPYIAWERVAARHKVSCATVRRAWRRFQADFEVRNLSGSLEVSETSDISGK